jgi:hypothetical protein
MTVAPAQQFGRLPAVSLKMRKEEWLRLFLWPPRHTARAMCALSPLTASKCVDCATAARFSKSNASGVLLVSDSKT